MLNFVNLPHYLDKSNYDVAIERMSKRLCSLSGVLAIYQIGSVSNPGISDIDLLVVFEDDYYTSFYPLKNLSETERYLFTHNVFAMSESFFKRHFKYTFYHNYKLLWGHNYKLDFADNNELKKQIALEFLICNYIARFIEKKYKIISVRNILLSVKAMKYDLEFLNVIDGALYYMIEQLIERRQNWFNDEFDCRAFDKWFNQFYDEFVSFLNIILKDNFLYVPEKKLYKYSKNVDIVPNNELKFIHRGLIIHYFDGLLPFRKIRAINNRLNHFKLYLPMMNASENSFINKRFAFYREMLDYNKKYVPNFGSLGNQFISKLF